jgi:riboflavin kinase/FMN adenylyltransferase
VTSVGTNPTFEVGGSVRVETHVLGFQGFLYGQEMSLEFLARLREQRTFASPEELVVQMNADAEAARDYFTSSSRQW